MANIVWTEGEKQFIKDNSGLMKDSEMAVKLSRSSGRRVTVYAVRKQRTKLGITKQPGRGVCKVVGQEEGATKQRTKLGITKQPGRGVCKVVGQEEGATNKGEKPRVRLSAKEVGRIRDEVAESLKDWPEEGV